MGVKLQSALGGSVELNAPSTASNFTMTVPAGNGTVATTDQLATFRNRVINGDMRIDQRNAGAVTSSIGWSTVDRWNTSKAGSATYSFQQVVDAPAGFRNSLKLTVTSALSPASTDTYQIFQNIEGTNIIDLAQGTGSASSMTLSFWVKSSVTGAYGISLANSNLTLWNVNTYTVNVANTWEYKTITFQGATSGTWATDNTAGIFVVFDLGSGSNQNTTTTGSWISTSGARRTSSCVNWTATSGATFQITGVQLEKGSVATSYEMRPLQAELALCQRYYNKTFRQSAKPANGTSNGIQIHVPAGHDPQVYVPFPVEMRTDPTVILYNPYQSGAGKDGQWYGAAFSNGSSSNARALSMTTRGTCIDNTDYGAPASGWCEIHFTAEAEL